MGLSIAGSLDRGGVSLQGELEPAFAATVGTDVLVPALELPLWLVTVAGVVTIAILMGISGFFSSSEIAMFALPQHWVDILVESSATNAAAVESLREVPHRLLVTILVGNNVANVAMSSVATALLGFYVTGGQAVLLTTVGIAALVLLFSESAPKSYAVENTESWALRVARPIQYAERLLYRFVVSFDELQEYGLLEMDDGDSRLYFTFLLGSSSGKRRLSEGADTASFVVYKIDTIYNWESVLLPGSVTVYEFRIDDRTGIKHQGLPRALQTDAA